MKKLTDKVDQNINLNPRWMYCCRNCDNTEYKKECLENEKCHICEHRYYTPTRLLD